MAEYGDEHEGDTSVAVVIVACVVGGLLALRSLGMRLFTLPGFGDVDLGNKHPTLKHGIEDVALVIAAARAMSTEFYRQQRPCLDGFFRIVLPVDDKHNGLLVLENLSEGMFSAKTAFIFRKKSKYGLNIEQDCFGPGATA